MGEAVIRVPRVNPRLRCHFAAIGGFTLVYSKRIE